MLLARFFDTKGFQISVMTVPLLCVIHGEGLRPRHILQEVIRLHKKCHKFASNSIPIKNTHCFNLIFGRLVFVGTIWKWKELNIFVFVLFTDVSRAPSLLMINGWRRLDDWQLANLKPDFANRLNQTNVKCKINLKKNKIKVFFWNLFILISPLLNLVGFFFENLFFILFMSFILFIASVIFYMEKTCKLGKSTKIYF